MPAINLLIKSTIDHSECSVALANIEVCGELISNFVDKMHPKLSSIIRVDINAATADIALVVDYLRNSHDLFWLEHWRTNLKSDCILPVLAIAVALQIPSLCRLLSPDTDDTTVDSQTLDHFFANL